MKSKADPAEHARARLAADPTPLALLRSLAKSRGPDLALISYRHVGAVEPQSLTFSQMLDEVERAAGRWVEAGVTTNDGIAIMLPHVHEAVIAFLAAMSVGVAFPVNPLLSVEALRTQLLLAGAKSAVIPGPDWPGDARARFLAAAESLPNLKIIEVDRDEGAPRSGSWSSFVEPGPSLPEFVGDPDRPAALFHTGGTTGDPKLAELSARNVVAGAIMSAAGWQWKRDDRVVVCLPLFHVGGAITGLLATFAAGAAGILPTALGARDPALIEGVWDVVDRNGATVLLMVPTSLAAVAEIPVGKASLATLRAVATGAAALPSDRCTKLEKMLGVPVSQGLGMTETSGVCALQPCDGVFRSQAVGYPVPMIEMRIASDPLQPQLGEISWRGPNCFRGYRTVHGLTGVPDGGWLQSGDIGGVGADGQLRLRGRSKDIIIRSGHNIDPLAIEEAASSHPAVHHGAAVPMPDEYAGELPALYVCLRNGFEVTEDELMRHVAERIVEPPARPQFLFFVSEIPLTPAGKFARYILRQRAVEWYVRRALGPGVEARITCTDIAAKTVDLQWGESVDAETSARAIGDLARVGLWVNVVPASSHLSQLQDETADENKEIS